MTSTFGCSTIAQRGKLHRKAGESELRKDDGDFQIVSAGWVSCLTFCNYNPTEHLTSGPLTFKMNSTRDNTKGNLTCPGRRGAPTSGSVVHRRCLVPVFTSQC